MVYNIYKDNDISASTRLRQIRPDYQRLLADARSGAINTIIAYIPPAVLPVARAKTRTSSNWPSSTASSSATSPRRRSISIPRAADSSPACWRPTTRT